MAEPQYLPVKVADLPVITDTDGLEFLGFQNQVFGRGDIELLKAKNMQLQYSNDSVNWHSTPVDGDMYFRTSADGGMTWSPALLYSDRLYTDGKIATEAAARHTEITDAVGDEATTRQLQVDALQQDIDTIEALIPNQATPENQLADKDFVNSSLNSIAAHRLSYNAAGDRFPTKADLTNATVFYYNGAEFSPTVNDYTVVAADESENGAEVRYRYTGSQWVIDYVVNDTPFTDAQNKSINSGITAELTDKLANPDANPTQSSTNLVTSGGVWSWFGAALSTLKTNYKTIVGSINELFDTKVDSAIIGSAAVTKSGTTLQLPAYPTSLPANGGNADTVNGKTHRDYDTARGVLLNGLLWDTGNIADYVTFENANRAAAVMGKRLPTQVEFAALAALPNKWDDVLKGCWFAATAADLATKDKTKCLFFPAAGEREYSDGSLINPNSYGYYWSSTESSSTIGCNLGFGSGGLNPSAITNKSYGFSARCVQDNSAKLLDADTLGGRKFDIYVQSAEPTNSLPGDIWIKP